jgi:hypothetical protein
VQQVAGRKDAKKVSDHRPIFADLPNQGEVTSIPIPIPPEQSTFRPGITSPVRRKKYLAYKEANAKSLMTEKEETAAAPVSWLSAPELDSSPGENEAEEAAQQAYAAQYLEK